MTDQCMHCTSRGDLNICEKTPCGKHEDWIVVELQSKIARLESALASRGGKVDAEAIMAVLPAEAIAVVVAFAINDHIKHPGPYCIDEIVGACEKISVDDISDVLPRPTPNED